MKDPLLASPSTKTGCPIHAGFLSFPLAWVPKKPTNQNRAKYDPDRPHHRNFCHPEQPHSRNERYTSHEREQVDLPSNHHKSGHPERSLARSVGQTQSKDPRLRPYSHKIRPPATPRKSVHQEQSEGPAFALTVAFALALAFAFLSVIPAGNLLFRHQVPGPKARSITAWGEAPGKLKRRSASKRFLRPE